MYSSRWEGASEYNQQANVASYYPRVRGFVSANLANLKTSIDTSKKRAAAHPVYQFLLILCQYATFITIRSPLERRSGRIDVDHCRQHAVDYHLKPIAKSCAATGREFVPGVKCHSALVEQEGQLVRFDYSEEGWIGPPDGTIGFWESVVPEPTETQAKPLDADALMRYFEQLCEDANPAQDKFRYVLALLLLQKRRLKIEGARRDGEIEYLELFGSRGEGTFEVRDQHLTDDEIGQLQQALNAHLACEWS